MLKLTIKLTLASLFFMSVGLYCSTGNVSAAVCNDADPVKGRDNWGVNVGENAGAMAGATIHATVGSYSGTSELPPNYNENLNVSYTLNAYNQDEGNNRIFTYPAGELGRKSAYQGITGGAIVNSEYNSVFCDGWDVFGPAAKLRDSQSGQLREQWGNRWILDCGIQNSTDFVYSRFWLSFVGKPSGSDGYWQVVVAGQDINVNVNEMSQNNKFFTVTNGETTNINLIWHPNKPPPPKPKSYETSGTCSSLSIANNESERSSNRRRIYVEVTGISLGRQRDNNNPATDVTYGPGTPNASGQPPGDPGGPGRPSSFGNPTVWVGGNENGLGPGDGSQSKQWFYIPWNSTTIHVKQTVEDRWDKTADGVNNPTWNPVGTYYLATNGLWSTTDQNVDCYKATCSILDVQGKGPDGITLADGLVSVHARLTNTSNNNLQLWNPALISSDNVSHYSNAVLDVGESTDYYYDIRAPSTVQQFNFSAYPVSTMGNAARAGPDCGGSAAVYQQFNIQPRANITNTDPENPKTVTYTGGGKLVSGSPVTVNTHITMDKQSPGGCPAVNESHDETDTYGDITHTYSYDNSSCINAGDLFCAHTTISPASGYHGPSNNLYTSDATADSTCLKTVNRPYTHFFGNDVTAGGGFSLSCNADQKGTIYTYSNRTGAPNGTVGEGGAGAQFGANAMSIISGLSTASLRGNNPKGVSGLSFANTEHVGDSSAPNETTGGYLGAANNLCVPDYFADDKPSEPKTADTSNGSVTPGTDGAQWYNPGGTGTGTLTLNGGTIHNGTKQAIFVEGNVNITDNIKYDDTAPGSVTQIPSFYLIVKGGNIHIDKDVTRLDGVYIAQPDTSSPAKLNKTGIINTCYVSNPNDIYNLCKNQLVINGAFVANRVLLTRSYSSLRYSQGNEYFNTVSTAPRHNCGNADKDVPSGADSATDCASEIFNFSPELYMSQPAINARFGSSSGKFDAITSLSPVL